MHICTGGSLNGDVWKKGIQGERSKIHTFSGKPLRIS